MAIYVEFEIDRLISLYEIFAILYFHWIKYIVLIQDTR